MYEILSMYIFIYLYVKHDCSQQSIIYNIFRLQFLFNIRGMYIFALRVNNKIGADTKEIGMQICMVNINE